MKQNMFNIKKKDTRGTSANCVFMSIDIVPGYFFVNFDFLSFSSVFSVNFEQVNTNWEWDSFTIN